MTEHTPEKVADLIADAWKTADRIRNVIGPSDRYADMIARLADALEAEHERAEWHALQEAGLRDDVATLEAERDEALAVIQSAYNAWHMESRQRAIDILREALSRIPEHPKED